MSPAGGNTGVREPLHLEPVTAARIGGTHRVRAQAGGDELFFESEDVALAPSPVAFASALLPAAVQHGRQLRVAEPLDPLWLDGVREIVRIWASWWSTSPDLADSLEARPAAAGRAPAASPADASRTALCFSGGVDSFHALLTLRPAPRILLFCEGYDIPLGDADRAASATRSLRAVAAATDSRAIVMRSNLRSHPAVRGSGWGRVHGGPLAALGHLCVPEVDELVVSSTHHVGEDARWGSHWQTDDMWSSSTLRVTHYGHEARRFDKVAALVDEPLARRHLRVCWENRAGPGNCGACEKCCRTMLQLEVAGADVARWPFAGSGSLAERIERVESVHPQQAANYVDVLPEISDPRLRAAVEGLIARTRDPRKTREERLRRRAERRARTGGAEGG